MVADSIYTTTTTALALKGTAREGRGGYKGLLCPSLASDLEGTWQSEQLLDFLRGAVSSLFLYLAP